MVRTNYRGLSLLLDVISSAPRSAVVSRRRNVMLVRHAESEHNLAERTRDWRGLLLQRDHGITAAGWDQCRALRDQLSSEVDDPSSPWSRDDLAVYASPLTRAAQTALLSLGDVPALRRGLTLVPEARELGAGPVYGRDCLGAAVGGDRIADRLVADARRAAPDAREDEAFARLVRDTPLDASRCEAKWWSSWEPHALARPRVDALLGELAGGDDGAPAVVVCHSLLIRSIFRLYGADDATRALADGYVPNCGVVSLDLVQYDDGRVAVADASLDFGASIVYAH